MTGVLAEKDIRAGAASRVMHSGVKAFRRHREWARRNDFMTRRMAYHERTGKIHQRDDTWDVRPLGSHHRRVCSSRIVASESPR